jgi:hypothetical protein
MFRKLLITLGLVLAACGVNSTATIGEEAFEPEVEGSSDALSSSKVGDWFPLAEGNTWVLRNAAGQTRTVSFSGLESDVAWLDGLLPEGRWAGITSAAPNTLYSWDPQGYWEPLFRFGYAVSSWSWGSGACGTFSAKRSATGRKVVTPAGTFTDTRSIAFTFKPAPNVRCAASADIGEYTFAARVGLVQLKTADGVVFDLVSAKVGTKTWPAPEVKATLTTDKAAYVSKGNTIRCITTPCPGNEEPATAKLTYKVTNTSSSTKTWSFSSGCQTNTLLFDANGAVVKNFEITRLCIQALTKIVLAPGQSKTWADELVLVGDDGTLLEGSYTAKTHLIPMDGKPALEASASFDVTVVYPTP